MGGIAWGYSPGLKMLAKVVPCSKIPAEYAYPTKNFYCEHMQQGATKTSADQNYDAWKKLVSVWPPTTQCIDDVAKLNAMLKQMWVFLGIPPWLLPVANCTDAKEKLERHV